MIQAVRMLDIVASSHSPLEHLPGAEEPGLIACRTGCCSLCLKTFSAETRNDKVNRSYGSYYDVISWAIYIRHKMPVELYMHSLLDLAKESIYCKGRARNQVSMCGTINSHCC